MSGVRTSWVSGSVAAQLTDEQAGLRVALAAGGLTLLGIVLLVFTVWWWRSTRPQPPVLESLALMGEREFREGDVERRRALLDELRAGSPERAPSSSSSSYSIEPVVGPSGALGASETDDLTALVDD